MTHEPYMCNFITTLKLNVNISVMPETEEQNRIRFQVELEFVQCLANPNYIHCKLNKSTFISYCYLTIFQK